LGRLNVSYREVKAALEGKLGLAFRGGKENTAWYVASGKKRFRVTAPKIHKGDVPPGTLGSIRNQIRLTTPQFADLIRCPMTGSDYEQLVRKKIDEGLL